MALPGPLAGQARVVRFAPAVGFGLGAGSRGARSTRSASFARCSGPEVCGTRDGSELQPKKLVSHEQHIS